MTHRKTSASGDRHLVITAAGYSCARSAKKWGVLFSREARRIWGSLFSRGSAKNEGGVASGAPTHLYEGGKGGCKAVVIKVGKSLTPS